MRFHFGARQLSRREPFGLGVLARNSTARLRLTISKIRRKAVSEQPPRVPVSRYGVIFLLRGPPPFCPHSHNHTAKCGCFQVIPAGSLARYLYTTVALQPVCLISKDVFTWKSWMAVNVHAITPGPMSGNGTCNRMVPSVMSVSAYFYNNKSCILEL